MNFYDTPLEKFDEEIYKEKIKNMIEKDKSRRRRVWNNQNIYPDIYFKSMQDQESSSPQLIENIRESFKVVSWNVNALDLSWFIKEKNQDVCGTHRYLSKYYEVSK